MIPRYMSLTQVRDNAPDPCDDMGGFRLGIGTPAMWGRKHMAAKTPPSQQSHSGNAAISGPNH